VDQLNVPSGYSLLSLNIYEKDFVSIAEDDYSNLSVIRVRRIFLHSTSLLSFSLSHLLTLLPFPSFSASYLPVVILCAFFLIFSVELVRKW
jgi:hypothetical protein